MMTMMMIYGDDDGDDDECGDGDSDGDGDGGLLVRPASQCDLYVWIILFSPLFFPWQTFTLAKLEKHDQLLLAQYQNREILIVVF